VTLMSTAPSPARTTVELSEFRLERPRKTLEEAQTKEQTLSIRFTRHNCRHVTRHRTTSTVNSQALASPQPRQAQRYCTKNYTTFKSVDFVFSLLIIVSDLESLRRMLTVKFKKINSCVNFTITSVLRWRRQAELHGTNGRTGHRLRRAVLREHPSVSSSQAAPAAAAATASPVGRAVAKTARRRGTVLRRRRPPVGLRRAAVDHRLPPETVLVRFGPDCRYVAPPTHFPGRRRSQHVPAIRLPVRQHRQLRSWRRRRGHAHRTSRRSTRRTDVLYRKQFHGANRRLPLPRFRRHGCQDEGSKCTADEWLVTGSFSLCIIYIFLFTRRHSLAVSCLLISCTLQWVHFPTTNWTRNAI